MRSPGFPIASLAEILRKNRNFGRFFLEIRGGVSLDSPSLAAFVQGD